MAIIYTYPRVQNPDGTELIVVSETKNQNATRVMSINDIAGLIPGTAGGTVTQITIDLASHGIDTGLRLWNGAWLATTQSISSSGSFEIGGTLFAGHGGTGQEVYSAGDILYYDPTPIPPFLVGQQLTKLPIGAANKVLTVNAGGTLPEWGDAKDGIYTGSGILPSNVIITNDGNRLSIQDISTTSSSLLTIAKGSLPSINSVVQSIWVDGLSVGGDQGGLYVANVISGGASSQTGIYSQVQGWAIGVETTSIKAQNGTGYLAIPTNSDIGVLTGFVSGAANDNASAYGVYSIVETTTSAVNYGAYLKASGGISNNYALITDGGQVGFNTLTPDASASVQIDSITQGFLPPRMTTGEIAAIAAPADGLMAYDTTLNELQFYDGTVWTSGGGGGIYGGSGSVLVNTTVTHSDNTLVFRGEGDGFIEIIGQAGVPTADHYAVKINNTKDGGFISTGAYIASDGITTGTGNLGAVIEAKNNPNINQTLTVIADTVTAGENRGIVIQVGNATTQNYALLATGGNVGIGTSTPASTSLLQLDSTTQAFHPPRMSTTDMNLIGGGSPGEGAIVFDIATKQFMGYNGTSWVILG